MSAKLPNPRQVRATAIKKLHAFEHSALDAYHALEDHNVKQLHQDVKDLMIRLSGWFTPKIHAFKTWYLAQPLTLRIVYGATLAPLMLLLSSVVLALIKLGAPVLLLIALALQLTLSLLKIVLFIGYIGYKILKTILMWYYTLSRLYTGVRAKRARFAAAAASRFPSTLSSAADQLSYRCRRKDLFIIHQHQGQIRVLFSYLRYALLGQQVLVGFVQRYWWSILTLWRSGSRELIKTGLTPVGASLFAPHTLGVHVTAERVLVPGDAELMHIILDEAIGSARLSFRIHWSEWSFKFQKKLKFLQIKREPRETIWEVEAPFSAPVPATKQVVYARRNAA